MMLARYVLAKRVPLSLNTRSNISKRHINPTLTKIHRQSASSYSTTSNGNSAVIPESELDVDVSTPQNVPEIVVNGNGNHTLIPEILGDGSSTDWSRSYFGLSAQPFSKETAEVLQQPLSPDDIEIKPGSWYRSPWVFRI